MSFLPSFLSLPPPFLRLAVDLNFCQSWPTTFEFKQFFALTIQTNGGTKACATWLKVYFKKRLVRLSYTSLEY